MRVESKFRKVNRGVRGVKPSASPLICTAGRAGTVLSTIPRDGIDYTTGDRSQ